MHESVISCSWLVEPLHCESHKACFSGEMAEDSIFARGRITHSLLHYFEFVRDKHKKNVSVKCNESNQHNQQKFHIVCRHATWNLEKSGACMYTIKLKICCHCQR